MSNSRRPSTPIIKKPHFIVNNNKSTKNSIPPLIISNQLLNDQTGGNSPSDLSDNESGWQIVPPLSKHDRSPNNVSPVAKKAPDTSIFISANRFSPIALTTVDELMDSTVNNESSNENKTAKPLLIFIQDQINYNTFFGNQSQEQVIQHQPSAHQPSSQVVTDGWMPIPQAVPNNCPNGLQYLSTINQLLVKQHVNRMEVLFGYETNNKYIIKDSAGQKLFYAVEDTGCCTRNCCGSIRPFEIKILDNYKKEVIHLSRPLACLACCYPCCLQSIEVFSPPGCLVGIVEQDWSILKPIFTIRNAANEEVLKIEGPICQYSMCGDVEFKILSKDKTTVVGRISKQWSGLLREVFTDADFFGISFPMDLDVRMKAVMLGACFLIITLLTKEKMISIGNQSQGLVIQHQLSAHQPSSQAVADGWMPIPQAVPRNCPNGLQYLSTIDELFVKQKFKRIKGVMGFELNNEYEIQNSAGKKVFYAVANTEFCTRWCWGSERPFETKILDNYYNEVIHVSWALPCKGWCSPCFLQRIEVFSPPGCLVGIVEENFSSIRTTFTIRNAANEEVLKIKRKIFNYSMCGGDVKFKILSNDKTVVGEISKQWGGQLRVVFTDADFFGISFHKDFDVRMKAVMLGACFFINFIESKQPSPSSDSQL
ncbi:hypothetical protein ACI65C_000797 [Semiaphis heraclei]